MFLVCDKITHLTFSWSYDQEIDTLPIDLPMGIDFLVRRQLLSLITQYYQPAYLQKYISRPTQTDIQIQMD